MFGKSHSNSFFLLVAIFEIFEFLFKFKINVIGPGQNFEYNFKKLPLTLQSLLNLSKL